MNQTQKIEADKMRFGTTPFPGVCIIEGMPYADYRAVDAVSWSTLREIGKSPERFKWVVENGNDDIEAGPMGTAFHAAVLEPAKFATMFSTYPATYPTLVSAADGWTCKAGDDGQYVLASGRGKARVEHAAQITSDGERYVVCSQDDISAIVKLVEKPWNNNATFCKAYAEAQDARGATILSRDDYQTVRAMADRLSARPDVQEMLANGRVEVSMFWTDPQTGLPCKGRDDLLWAGDQIADLKMTQKSAQWERWGSTVRGFGYAGQMAMYRDGLDVIHQYLKKPRHDVRLFRWLVAESEAPYSTFVYECQDVPGSISYDWFAYGRALWHGYLQQLADCIKWDRWPGGNEEAEELAVPEWLKLEAKAVVPIRHGPDPAQAEAEASMAAELDAMKGMNTKGVFDNG